MENLGQKPWSQVQHDHEVTQAFVRLFEHVWEPTTVCEGVRGTTSICKGLRATTNWLPITFLTISYG